MINIILIALINIVIFMFGACIFSFINVVAYRLPRKMDYVNSKSICTFCEKQLKGIYLIPIFSYIFLKGKCGYCKEKISIRYFLMEIVGGILALGVYNTYFQDIINYEISFLFKFLLVFAMVSVLTIITIIDAETMEIPNGLCIWLLILAVPSYFLFPEIDLVSRLIGAFCISVPMFLLCLVINGAFGGGDIKLMASIGLMLGWQLNIVATFIAIVIGGVYAGVNLCLKKLDNKSHFAFGPFLCIGIVIAWFFGDVIINWYLGFFNL